MMHTIGSYLVLPILSGIQHANEDLTALTEHIRAFWEQLVTGPLAPFLEALPLGPATLVPFAVLLGLFLALRMIRLLGFLLTLSGAALIVLTALLVIRSDLDFAHLLRTLAPT